MPAYSRPRWGFLTGFASGENGWGLTTGGYNDVMLRLDAMLHVRVASFTPSNAPPGSPTNGLTVIVGSSPTGAFVGHAGKFAVWNSDAAAWFFLTIPEGVLATATDTGNLLCYNSGSFTIPPNIEPPVVPDPVLVTPSRVSSFTPLNTPPGSPAAGDVHLIGASPTGAWTGEAGKLAEWSGTAWVFYTLRYGDGVTAEDTGHFRVYDGTTFVVPPNIEPPVVPDLIYPTPSRVESFTPSVTPPGSPADGDVYLVGASATGAWAGEDGKLARWEATPGIWRFFTLLYGDGVTAEDTGHFRVYNGTTFVVPPNIEPPEQFFPTPVRVVTFTRYTAPPGGPHDDGDTYHVDLGGSGAFAGKDLQLASWDSDLGFWRFFIMDPGHAVRADDTGEWLVWQGEFFDVPQNITTTPSRVASFTPSNTPPGSPADGDVILVGSSPTGAFSGQAGKLALWSDLTGAWAFYTPIYGDGVTAEDTGHFRVYDGTDWVVPPNLDPGTPPDPFDPNTLIPREIVSATPQNDAPGSPAENDAYIVSGSPSGAFSGQAGKLAKYVSATWLFFTPPVGHAVVAQDTRHLTVWSGTAWIIPPNLIYTPPARTVRISFTLEGALTNGIVLARVPFDTAVQFAATPTGSRADAKVAATAETTIAIWKEEAGGTRTNVGSLVWAAAGTVATISFTSTTSFAAGDLIEFLGPVTADATLADIGFLIVGTEA